MLDMKLTKIPIILFCVSPAISVFRCWQIADAQVKGLLSNQEMQQQLLTPVLYASAVYLICLVGCVIHMKKNPRVGGIRMGLWILGIALFPVVFAPLYVALHVGR